MVFMAAVNGAPHIPGMGGWVTYGVQNREVHDGEWWKGNGNGAAGAGLKAGPAWWGHGKEATSWHPISRTLAPAQCTLSHAPSLSCVTKLT